MDYIDIGRRGAVQYVEDYADMEEEEEEEIIFMDAEEDESHESRTNKTLHDGPTSPHSNESPDMTKDDEDDKNGDTGDSHGDSNGDNSGDSNTDSNSKSSKNSNSGTGGSTGTSVNTTSTKSSEPQNPEVRSSSTGGGRTTDTSSSQYINSGSYTTRASTMRFSDITDSNNTMTEISITAAISDGKMDGDFDPEEDEHSITLIEEDDYQQFKGDYEYSEDSLSTLDYPDYDFNLLGSTSVTKTNRLDELIAFYRQDREFAFAPGANSGPGSGIMDYLEYQRYSNNHRQSWSTDSNSSDSVIDFVPDLPKTIKMDQTECKTSPGYHDNVQQPIPPQQQPSLLSLCNDASNASTASYASSTPRAPLPNGPTPPSIRVMSWNVLADGKGYALSDRHGYCDVRWREWEYRGPRILASILACSPDVCCLQETTGPMYREFIGPQFGRYGYHCLHIQKDRKHAQSDTLIYRKDRFDMICFQNIELGALSDRFADTVFGPKNSMFRSFLSKTRNVALMAKFRDNWSANKQEFVVVAGHLFWSPDRPHIKSAQMFELNAFLVDTFLHDPQWRIPGVDYSGDPKAIIERVPVVFACDSNSVPRKLATVGHKVYISSGVQKIMCDGKLDRIHLDHPIAQYRLRYANSVWFDGEFDPQMTAEQLETLQIIRDWSLETRIRWRSAYDTFNATKRIIRRGKNRKFGPRRQHQLNQYPFEERGGGGINELNDHSVFDMDLNDDHHHHDHHDDEHPVPKMGANEPIFTNKAGEFCDTIDYIYVSPPVDVVGILKMPYDKSSIERAFHRRKETDLHMEVRWAEYRSFHGWYRNCEQEIRNAKGIRRHAMLFKGFVFGDDRNNNNNNDDGLGNGRGHHGHHNNNDDDDHIPTNIVTLLMAYAETSDEWYKHVDTQRHYQGQQSLWRMVRMSQRDSHLRESACFSAWNYPQMPNRKDPSDHFALCIDVKIEPTTDYAHSHSDSSSSSNCSQSGSEYVEDTESDDYKVDDDDDDDDDNDDNEREDVESRKIENGRNNSNNDLNSSENSVSGECGVDDEYYNWTVCD